MKAVALVSGGLDSCVALAMAKEEGLEVTEGLSVFYGQKHSREAKSSARICSYYGICFHAIDLSGFGLHIASGTALINKEEALPQDRALSAMTARVPRSYVPGRNTIMLALAQSIAEVHEARRIVVGFNAVDFSGYPDCRPIYVSAWNHLAKYATRAGYEENDPIEVFAPIINKSKASVVAEGIRLKAPLELTWSCYEGREKACRRCDSCRIRLDAFAENNLKDPIEYEVL